MEPSRTPSGQWMWHPDWIDRADRSAGAFVHFRAHIQLESQPINTVHVNISADTKYKLYVNSELVCHGPVKGDASLWFYDQVDIQPYLKPGPNNIAVRVMRLFHATQYATSFPRLVSPGLLVEFPQNSSSTHFPGPLLWETALDPSTILPTNFAEDDFLHTYEFVNCSRDNRLQWIPVKYLDFPTSHGLSPPWKLSPRMIPLSRLELAHFKQLHNVRSVISIAEWERVLLSQQPGRIVTPIRLLAGSSHHLELEACHHITAFLRFYFGRPAQPGASLTITYSECYEDQPIQTPYLRSKHDRCDTTKHLLGPQDRYVFGGQQAKGEAEELHYDVKMGECEIFSPFHYRTFRFLTLDIEVAKDSDLVFQNLEMISTNYDLDLKAKIKVGLNANEDQHPYEEIWSTSVRTLINCMHDCYEDCPFYEQLQYAMDTRSSILFTYLVSGDDRLARQAIVQLHNSYQPGLGLTASRAPAHQLQLIPHFSLFWIATVADHFEHFADSTFTRQFVSTCDGVLEHFAQRIDPVNGLVRFSLELNHWEFVDWTDAWRPMGIPPAAARTGFCTYTSMLYSYTLKLAANMLVGIGRPTMATEYWDRAESVVRALRKYCFDGAFFTDGLASGAILTQDYSEHQQIWGVLCGAIEGHEAEKMLQSSLFCNNKNQPTHPDIHRVKFAPVSTAMSFYKLRALSLVGGSLYNEHFHSFWTPWTTQLSLNLSTWEEDDVSHRSDCHAWGCAPLFEFAAEVAGIYPAKPGWSMINFCPRISLFSSVDISVPFGGCQASRAKSPFGSGVARVKWYTEANGEIVCSLLLETYDSKEHIQKTPPVRITLPNRQDEVVQDSSAEIVRVIKALK